MDGAILAAFLSAATAIVLVFITVRQTRLQEAATYKDQAVSWGQLRKEWQVLLTVGYGPEAAINHGVTPEMASHYEDCLSEYRDARVKMIQLMDRESNATSTDGFEHEWEDVSAEQRTALARVREFEPSVRLILIHLAQVSDLVLRRRISIDSVYDALGHDVRREQKALRNVFMYPADEDGCPGSSFPEMRAWASMPLDEVSARVGWGMVLEHSPATLDRIDVLVDLIVCRALRNGDHPSPRWMGDEPRQCLGRKRQAIRWAVMTRQSKWLAFRTCVGTTWLGHRPDLLMGGFMRNLNPIPYWFLRPLVVVLKVFRTWFDSHSATDNHRFFRPGKSAKR